MTRTHLTKTCPKCGESKPLTDFYRDAAARDGLRPECKVCANRYSAAYYVANPGKRAAYRAANSDKTAATRREYRAANAEKTAATRRERLYGITQPQYDALLKKQAGRCVICRDAFGDKTPHIDHCHESGRVRGLLCRHCNRGIGGLRDNPTICRSAVTYLEGAPCG